MDTVSFSKSATTPQMRIGDAERQAAGRRLEQHYADGRLTWEELDERLAKAYAARVEDELTCLFDDLPTLAPPPSPPEPLRARLQHASARLREGDVRRVVLLALVAAAAIAATHGIIIFPAVFVWLFIAGRHRGGRGPWHGSHHHRHGSGHGRAWG